MQNSELESFSALQRAEIAEIGSPTRSLTTAIKVSVLFNEPKLLKCVGNPDADALKPGFSALQRAEIAEIFLDALAEHQIAAVSVLFNEPKLLKCLELRANSDRQSVSVLFNEPKLLK